METHKARLILILILILNMNMTLNLTSTTWADAATDVRRTSIDTMQVPVEARVPIVLNLGSHL